MTYEAPARPNSAPAVPDGSRAGADESTLATLTALELAPAPGILSAPHAAVNGADASHVPASSAPALLPDSDGSLRASLARMMAAEHRWPAPALATGYAELPANLSGAPRPRKICHFLFPSRFCSVMQVAVCASGGDMPPARDARAPFCSSPAQSFASACPLPAAFLPPAMTLAELTALAATAEPDALKAFVNGQPSLATSAVVAGALAARRHLRDALPVTLAACRR